MAVIEELREVIGDQEAFTELERLAEKNAGDLTPDLVVGAAADPNSPLHSHFEWDNGKAAVEWRKHQARQLIQTFKLHVVDDRGERTTRYYANVVVADQHVYRRTEDIIRVDALREQHRLRFVRDLNRINTELQNFDEFAVATKAVTEAIAALNGEG